VGAVRYGHLPNLSCLGSPDLLPIPQQRVKWIRELSLWERMEVGTEHYFNLILLKYFGESASDIYKQ